MSAQVPLDYDWKRPDFVRVFEQRIQTLNRLRKSPELLAAFHSHYKQNPAQFIIDWGVTFDAKNVERGLPTLIPFLLFPKQVEWIEWIERKWRASEPGLTEKTRQMGFSWLAMAWSCTKCLYNDGMVIGFGSRKEEYVDKLGDPKSLFEKGRIFMRNLPPEFRGGWTEADAPHKTIRFPRGNGAQIAGEAGDEIGRGNTTSIYFVDEAAFIERPMKVDAALSQTTNCRIDISTPNGMANTFAQKRHGGKVEVFIFDWRDDPRKDQIWYDKQKSELDPIIVAQEIDRNYSASVEGVVIPGHFVKAAIGAHLKLKIEPTGKKRAALDVADEGRDKNALAGRHGILLQHLKSWSGASLTIYKSTMKAFNLCDEWGYDRFDYDADGLGAGVRGDAEEINKARRSAPHVGQVRVTAFRGSAAVVFPEAEMVKGRQNKDYFANLKAQSWWHLRLLFERTYGWVVDGKPCDPDKIISIDPNLPELRQLEMELSQATYTRNEVGKIVIDKQPDGILSPNLADAVVIAYNPSDRGIEVWEKLGKR